MPTRMLGGLTQAEADARYVRLTELDEEISELAMAGRLLAVKTKPSTSGTTITTSVALVDVDAANLVVTFTVPPSGKVLVRLAALTKISNASRFCNWGLREGAVSIAMRSVTSNTTFNYLNLPMLITGLNPGDVKTYKFAFASTNVDSTASIDNGEEATMEVWEAL